MAPFPLQIARLAATVLLILFSGYSLAAILPPCKAPSFLGQAKVAALQSPFLTAYNNVLLENEASGGKLAYCLSRSGMEESGLSFGVSQFDLRTNDLAWPSLLKIIAAGTRGGAANSLPPETIALLENRLRGKGAPKAKDLLLAKDDALDRGLEFVNAALASPLGRAIVDDLHVQHLLAQDQFLNRTVEALKDSSFGAGTLLQHSLSARLFLVDYSNLFGGIDQKLKPFLGTGSVELSGGKIRMLNDKVGFTDLLRFVLATKQAQGCKANERVEVLRRVNTVLQVSRREGEILALTNLDKAYLSQDFASILASKCVAQHKYDLGQLEDLVRESK
jgi:hypothetical protein